MCYTLPNKICLHITFTKQVYSHLLQYCYSRFSVKIALLGYLMQMCYFMFIFMHARLSLLSLCVCSHFHRNVLKGCSKDQNLCLLVEYGTIWTNLGTGLQTATKFFSAFASKFCEQMHWRDHHIVQLVLPFLLHMRNITSQTRQKLIKIPLLVWAAQHGPFISSHRNANKLDRVQNGFTPEPMLMSREKRLNSPHNQ